MPGYKSGKHRVFIFSESQLQQYSDDILLSTKHNHSYKIVVSDKLPAAVAEQDWIQFHQLCFNLALFSPNHLQWLWSDSHARLLNVRSIPSFNRRKSYCQHRSTMQQFCFEFHQ
jgi:hypothetical protein